MRERLGPAGHRILFLVGLFGGGAWPDLYGGSRAGLHAGCKEQGKKGGALGNTDFYFSFDHHLFDPFYPLVAPPTSLTLW